MDKEMKEYIKECDCPKIQNWIITELDTNSLSPINWDCKYIVPISEWEKVWKIDGSKCEPQILNTASEYHYPELDYRDLGKIKKGVIFLPSLDQAIEMLGERFVSLINDSDGFRCFASGRIPYFTGIGSSRRIAVVKAVKEIGKEK